MSELLASIDLERPEHVFALRHSGRVAAAGVGCDDADQVRLATALSEIGRESLAHANRGASANFFLDADDALSISITGFPRAAAAASHLSEAITLARKLVPELTIESGRPGETATVLLRRPRAFGTPRPNAAALRARLRETSALLPLDELRLENRDLAATLERVQAQREELVLLNSELEETNRGVLAMYAKIEGELEETNRGVVALYAELDDKTQLLHEANEAKSRFLASVSHELRSPVNSILGLLQLLLDDTPGDENTERRKQLQLALRSSNDLLELVNDLLDLAKAESGRLQPHVSLVELPELFNDLRGSLRPLTAPGVELVVECESVPPIETDRTLLAQVLRNLVSNALKFTERGSVRLVAEVITPLQVTIRVEDTGVGIDSANHTRIFEEFFQVRGPLQARVKGTGLGLPYAKRVTQALGGRMELQSALGRGSTFTVTLPVQWQGLLNAPLSSVEAQGTVRIGNVLVVDDDHAFRTAIRGLLQGTASQVREARGGAEALQMMRASRPDLVLMDLRMPGMDGAELLAEMASDPPLRTVPVIIVTAAELDAAARPTVGGAAALLAKSNVSEETLRRAIEKALHA